MPFADSGRATRPEGNNQNDRLRERPPVEDRESSHKESKADVAAKMLHSAELPQKRGRVDEAKRLLQ